MQAELEQTHAEMEAALADLAAITGEATFDEPRLASARVRLSRASGKRRRIVDAAILNLLETASPDDARKLRGLRERNATQLEASTKHIGGWGMRHIVADWPGYCRASVAMRQSIHDLIAADRETLFPLLSNTP
jgi:hypothetical protein